MHLGGDNLNSINLRPRDLADQYYAIYTGVAHVFVFCSVVRWSNPRNVNNNELAELAAQFNPLRPKFTGGGDPN